MATRTCPECGAEYIASATRCADCDVELVAGSGVDPEAVGEPDPNVEQMTYDLSEWSGEARTLLDQLLVGELIAHVWESGTLVVGAVDERRVDRLVDQVEVTDQPTLDPDVDRIVYELDGWDEERRSQLGEALTTDGVAHGWDDDDNLVVAIDDQDHTDAVVDRVATADLIDADPRTDDEDGDDGQGEGDGPDAESVMSDLFVVADRLLHHPKDRHDARQLAAATDAAAGLRLPYGIARPVWDDLIERVEALRSAVEAEPLDEADVLDAAKSVREHLRDYV